MLALTSVTRSLCCLSFARYDQRLLLILTSTTRPLYAHLNVHDVWWLRILSISRLSGFSASSTRSRCPRSFRHNCPSRRSLRNTPSVRRRAISPRGEWSGPYLNAPRDPTPFFRIQACPVLLVCTECFSCRWKNWTHKSMAVAKGVGNR